MAHHFFTSESVTEGHPDKICDQISDAILNEILTQDPYARVACETTCTTGMVQVMGEISTSCYVDIPKVVRDTVREIGYDRAKYGFDCDTCAVLTAIDEQSADIALGVDNSLERKEGASESDLAIGAGDQGMMFGYACDEMATNSAPERNHENEIWNPWAALWLSIIFTPVFGTMLQGTDLRHIGDKEGADAAFLWERFSMILLAIAAIIQPIAAIRPGWGLTLFIVDIVLLVGWAATCGFRHAIRIREAQKLSKRLVSVPTSKAITFGVLGLAAWTALFYIAKMFWQLIGVIPYTD